MNGSEQKKQNNLTVMLVNVIHKIQKTKVVCVVSNTEPYNNWTCEQTACIK